MDEFDDTQTLYAPQLELKTDGGLSTLYLMDPIHQQDDILLAEPGLVLSRTHY